MKCKYLLLGLVCLIVAIIVNGMSILKMYNIDLMEYINYSLPFTDSEEEFLTKKKIRYGININHEPFSFISEEHGQNSGIIVDYFNQLAIVLETKMKPVSFQSHSLAKALKDKRIDAAILKRNAMTEKVFLLTQTLYIERNKILLDGESKLNKISELKNISIAVIAGSKAHHDANRLYRNEKNVNFVLTNSLEESFSLLAKGNVEAILGDEAEISYHLNQGLKSRRFKFLDGTVSQEEVCVAVNKDNQILLDILNKGILELKKGEQFNHIHARWFGSLIPEVSEVGSVFNYNLISNVILFILILIIMLIAWNKTVSQKVAERTEELMESRTALRNVMDSLSDALVVINKNGKIESCNKSATEFIGKDFSSIIGRNISDFDILNEFIIHDGEREPFLYKNRHFLVHRKNLTSSSNNSIISIEDYTERYKYEKLTRQEAKMIAIGELLAGLAHEIRNPLGLIKSYVYLISRDISKPPNPADVAAINCSADRINTLIENLLGFSRLSREKTEVVNVEELINSSLILEYKTLEKHNIDINVDIKRSRIEKIRVNPDILKLCLVNLVNNSIDALKDTQTSPKNISIIVYGDESILKIDIIDNGVGIKKDSIGSVFNPFFTTKENGTGLGLYILDTELRSINGTISVRSTYGTETCFHVELPIEVATNKESSYG
ncbi:MAG: transporter substrate-binding domain-containing protein [Clostridiales bacterium]|nr:transporter substrate-binding domain-containing protein [Clostridiales bacterium]MDY4060517.1 transporter substrate-binding domain-containing protein [Anaerovoracaceae bacterium]